VAFAVALCTAYYALWMTMRGDQLRLTIRRRLADRIWQWRKLAYAASTALVVVAIVGVFVSIATPTANMEPSTGPAFFDAGRAYEATQEIARLYPRRELGSTEAVGAAAWFAERLDTLNIPYTQTVFEAPLGFKRVGMRNIAVVLMGTSTDTIMVTAARDPNLDPQLPPLADASGTGMLLELIQVFASRPHEKTIIFLSSEGGGYGGLGVNEFLDQYGRRERVKAILSVQGLGKELTEELQGGVTGPRSTTPGWYVQLVANTLDKVGVRLHLPGLEKQIADQVLGLSEGEQVAGLRRGIASLTLRDLGGGVVTAAGLATQGSAVERLILSLDAGGRTPTDPGTALVLESGRYLTVRALTILGILLLLPLAIMALTWLAVTRMRPDAWLRHLRNLVSFMIPLVVLPVLMWLGQIVGLLPRYLFQAPAVPSPATQPRLVPVLVLVLVFGAIFLFCRHFLGYLRYREPRAMTEMAKLSVGLITLLVGLTLLATQSPFLLLPWVSVAWIWPLVSCFRDAAHSTLTWWPHLRSNLLLLLMGFLTPLAFYLYLAFNTTVGFWKSWWFLMVQMVSGAFGLKAPFAWALIATALVILLGVKRLQLIPIETLEESDDLSYVQSPPPRVRRVKLRNIP
jgi:hypothetical protein